MRLLLSCLLFLLVESLLGSAQSSVPPGCKKVQTLEAALAGGLSCRQVEGSLENSFIARVQFGRTGRVQTVTIAPNYMFDGTIGAIKNRHLSFMQYEDLVSRINRVQPLGALVSKGGYGLVTNATKVPVVDEYENAFVKRAVALRPGKKELVNFFSIYYIHDVTGQVEEKRTSNDFGGNIRVEFQVKIAGKWFYAMQKESERAVLNSTMSLKVAGPVEPIVPAMR